MTLYFITGNKGKFREVRAILDEEVKQLDINLPEIQSTDARAVIEAKLLEALKHKKGEFIVEDVSLYLDCLNGLPGPLIKWFLEAIGNEGIYNLANKLGNKKVEVKCIIGYAKNAKEIHFFEGVVRGRVVQPRGTGFGWDPLFIAEGYTETFGELSPREKNKISMRRLALNKLRDFMSQQ